MAIRQRHRRRLDDGLRGSTANAVATAVSSVRPSRPRTERSRSSLRASISSSICSPAVGDPDQDDPAVLGDAGPFDEAALLDPVDETGRVRQRDVEHVGQTAHRHLAAPLERVQDVELSHADAEPDEPFARSRT